MKYIENDTNIVRKYGMQTIYAHWILLISVIGLIITGVFPFFNENLTSFNAINFSLPVVPYSHTLHYIFGFVLIFAIIFVTFTHSMNLRDILKGKLKNNIGEFFRSILFIIGFDKRLKSGAGYKFYGYQKITFIGFVFSLWMLIFSGILLFFGLYAESSISNTLAHSLHLLHYFGALLILTLFVYHTIMALRRFDRISFRCIFYNGKLPIWYIKKHNKIWYDEIKK